MYVYYMYVCTHNCSNTNLIFSLQMILPAAAVEDCVRSVSRHLALAGLGPRGHHWKDRKVSLQVTERCPPHLVTLCHWVLPYQSRERHKNYPKGYPTFSQFFSILEVGARARWIALLRTKKVVQRNTHHNGYGTPQWIFIRLLSSCQQPWWDTIHYWLLLISDKHLRLLWPSCPQELHLHVLFIRTHLPVSSSSRRFLFCKSCWRASCLRWLVPRR